MTKERATRRIGQCESQRIRTIPQLPTGAHRPLITRGAREQAMLNECVMNDRIPERILRGLTLSDNQKRLAALKWKFRDHAACQ
jgi:hypothetical protein